MTTKAILPIAVIGKAVFARFSVTHAYIVLGLIPMAQDAERHKQRLPAAAYRKGLIAGLSHDSTDATYPECPYDRSRLPNFARGANDPREAWRDGSKDGLRIRDMILRPEIEPNPGLQYREYKLLTRQLREAHDLRTMNLAREVEASSGLNAKACQ